jgi:hypothetical protein
VVELHVLAVTDVERGEVVVGDVGRIVAAADRSDLGHREPFPVLLHERMVGEQCRHGRGHPAGLEIGGRVRLGAHPHEPVLLAHPEQGPEHRLAVLPGAEELEAGLAGHAVPQAAHAAALDGELGHVEELDVGQRGAGHLLDQCGGGGALQLVPVELRRTGRPDGGVVVTLGRGVVVAALEVEGDPVDDHRVPDEIEQLLLEVEEDGVADQVAVGVHRDELLRLADAEVRERVHGQVAEQPECVGPREEEVGHVVRLVEQRTGLHPRPLLGAPVGELRLDREGARREGEIPQQLDRATGAGEGRGQTLGGHVGAAFRRGDGQEKRPARVRRRTGTSPRPAVAPTVGIRAVGRITRMTTRADPLDAVAARHVT